MLFTELKVDDKAYKLRLNTRNTVMLEKLLGGKNPLSIFNNEDELPTVTVMVNILFASLQQYHHSIDINEAYDIFDSYLSEGHTATDFIKVIMDIYKASGIIADDKKKDNNEKNGLKES